MSVDIIQTWGANVTKPPDYEAEKTVACLYAMDPSIELKNVVPTTDAIAKIRWKIYFRLSLTCRLLLDSLIPEWVWNQ